MNAKTDIVRCGQLKKLKTLKKKFFVLRDASIVGSARLEYYDNEKKLKLKQPKRVIVLETCFHIMRRFTSKHEYLIILYTKDDSFGIVFENEATMKDWLQALQEHYQASLPPGSRGPQYAHVWNVKITPKGLVSFPATTDLKPGEYLMGLGERIVCFTPVHEAEPTVILQLDTLSKIGNLTNAFQITIGRAADVGPGVLEVLMEDQNIAQSAHETLLSYMTRSKANPTRPRSKSQSMSTRPVQIGSSAGSDLQNGTDDIESGMGGTHRSVGRGGGMDRRSTMSVAGGHSPGRRSHHGHPVQRSMSTSRPHMLQILAPGNHSYNTYGSDHDYRERTDSMESRTSRSTINSDCEHSSSSVGSNIDTSSYIAMNMNSGPSSLIGDVSPGGIGGMAGGYMPMACGTFSTPPAGQPSVLYEESSSGYLDMKPSRSDSYRSSSPGVSSTSSISQDDAAGGYQEMTSPRGTTPNSIVAALRGRDRFDTGGYLSMNSSSPTSSFTLQPDKVTCYLTDDSKPSPPTASSRIGGGYSSRSYSGNDGGGGGDLPVRCYSVGSNPVATPAQPTMTEQGYVDMRVSQSATRLQRGSSSKSSSAPHLHDDPRGHHRSHQSAHRPGREEFMEINFNKQQSLRDESFRPRTVSDGKDRKSLIKPESRARTFSFDRDSKNVHAGGTQQDGSWPHHRQRTATISQDVRQRTSSMSASDVMRPRSSSYSNSRLRKNTHGLNTSPMNVSQESLRKTLIRNSAESLMNSATASAERLDRGLRLSGSNSNSGSGSNLAVGSSSNKSTKQSSLASTDDYLNMSPSSNKKGMSLMDAGNSGGGEYIDISPVGTSSTSMIHQHSTLFSVTEATTQDTLAISTVPPVSVISSISENTPYVEHNPKCLRVPDKPKTGSNAAANQDYIDLSQKTISQSVSPQQSYVTSSSHSDTSIRPMQSKSKSPLSSTIADKYEEDDTYSDFQPGVSSPSSVTSKSPGSSTSTSNRGARGTTHASPRTQSLSSYQEDDSYTVMNYTSSQNYTSSSQKQDKSPQQHRKSSQPYYKSPLQYQPSNRDNAVTSRLKHSSVSSISTGTGSGSSTTSSCSSSKDDLSNQVPERDAKDIESVCTTMEAPFPEDLSMGLFTPMLNPSQEPPERDVTIRTGARPKVKPVMSTGGGSRQHPKSKREKGKSPKVVRALSSTSTSSTAPQRQSSWSGDMSTGNIGSVVSRPSEYVECENRLSTSTSSLPFPSNSTPPVLHHHHHRSSRSPSPKVKSGHRPAFDLAVVERSRHASNPSTLHYVTKQGKNASSSSLNKSLLQSSDIEKNNLKSPTSSSSLSAMDSHNSGSSSSDTLPRQSSQGSLSPSGNDSSNNVEGLNYISLDLRAATSSTDAPPSAPMPAASNVRSHISTAVHNNAPVERPLSYAEIDFTKSESLKNTKASRDQQVQSKT